MAATYRPYTPTREDAYFIEKAVKYRHDMIPPAQSNFRVISIFTYKEIQLIDDQEYVRLSKTNCKNKNESRPLNLTDASYIETPDTQYVIGCNGTYVFQFCFCFFHQYPCAKCFVCCVFVFCCCNKCS